MILYTGADYVVRMGVIGVRQEGLALIPGMLSVLGRRPIAFQIGVLVASTALPLIVASGVLFASLASIERERADEDLIVQAKAIAALVDNEIKMHVAIAQSLAASAKLRDDDLTDFRMDAETAIQVVPGSWLVLSRPDARTVLSTKASPDAALPARPQPEVMRRAFVTGRPQVGDLARDPSSNTLAPYVEVPVFRDGAPAYSIAVVMDPARFLGLFSKKIADGELVGLVDRDKRFIAHIPDQEGHLGRPAGEGWQAAMEKSPEGWTEGQTLEGTYALTGYARTAYGWTVGVAVPEAQLTAPATKLLRKAAIVSIGLVGLSAVLASLVARRITSGMSALALTASRVGAGEVVEAPDAPFGEAQAIAAALATASTELKRRADLLVRDNLDLEAEVAKRSEELRRQITQKAEVEEQLRQSQKLDVLGKLAGGVAHDFNNALTVIVMSLETMKRQLQRGNSNVADTVDAALRATEKAAALTKRLLVFARRQPLQPAVIDLNRVIRNLSDFLVSTIGAQIELRLELADGLWLVDIDPSEFEHVLVNLAANGRDAMESGGRLTIATHNADVDRLLAARDPNAPAAPTVVVTVRDTGHGMDAKTLARVFEPFFSTKPAGKGTGLGLSQAHGFVTQSGGGLDIWSETQKGTTVQIWFPRSEDGETQPAPKAAPAPPPRARPGETILVVEDEDRVRSAVCQTLRELGYATIEAANGDEALLVTDRFDLLLTDIVMPGINGFEVAERLRERRGDLGAIFMTGYVPGSVLKSHDPENVFRKPFTFEQLAIRVRKTLDARLLAEVGA